MTQNKETPNPNPSQDPKRSEGRKPEGASKEPARGQTGKPAQQSGAKGGVDPRGPQFDDRPGRTGGSGKSSPRQTTPTQQPGRPEGVPDYGDTEKGDPRHTETDAGKRQATRGDSGKTNQPPQGDEK